LRGPTYLDAAQGAIIALQLIAQRTASSAQLRRLLRSGAEDKNRNRLQAPPEDERLLDQQQMGSRQLAPAPRLG
jgi:SOS response regulatory protein OraA/RecX